MRHFVLDTTPEIQMIFIAKGKKVNNFKSSPKKEKKTRKASISNFFCTLFNPI